MSRSASETAAALRLIAILQPDQSRGANLNREGGEMDSKTRDLERAQDKRGKHFVNSQLYTLIQLVLGAATFFMLDTRWYYALAAAVAVWFTAGLPRTIVFVRQVREVDRLLSH